MDQPRGRYKVEQVVQAWAKAAELVDDPCFGLEIADVWSPTDLHALGYAFLASSTLRNALMRLSRYVHVIDNVVGFELDEGDENNLQRGLSAYGLSDDESITRLIVPVYMRAKGTSDLAARFETYSAIKHKVEQGQLSIKALLPFRLVDLDTTVVSNATVDMAMIGRPTKGDALVSLIDCMRSRSRNSHPI